MVAAAVLFRVHAETAASAASANGEQAYQSAMSGLQTVIALLSPPAEQPTAADGTALPVTTFANPAILGDPTKWYDNETLFKNKLVHDDGANRWYFSIYSVNTVAKETVRFGLTDESGKINLATADEEMIARLPGMTPQLVAALLDWRDGDADTRTDGAEQDYYDQLGQPYNVRNGALMSIEELLLIKGFTGGIVYGEDANLNTLLEPNEDDGDENFPPDNNDGVLDMGLYGSATVASYGPDLGAEGAAKTDLNSGGARAKMQELSLSAQTTQFVERFRADGGRFKHPSELLNMSYKLKKDAGGGGGGKGKGSFGKGGGAPGTRAGDTITSGVTVDDMPAIMANFTTAPGGGRAPAMGLLNVNTALIPALAALPGIDSAVAQQIVEARGSLDAETRSNTAWLVTQGIVDADTYKAVAPKLCTQGFQYRLRIVGFGVPCGRYRIFEVVLDVAGPQPRVLYQRDITRLGLPFPLDPEAEEL